jgi:signal transduction histidine kinase
MRRGPPRNRFARGFGCLAGIVFLVVASSLLIATTFVLERLGPVPSVIAIATVFGILVAIAFALRAAGRSLDRILSAMTRVEAGDYTVRVGRSESDFMPIRDLTAGFDTMVGRLEADEEQRRTLLADVSHELRTPLTVIAGGLEAMIDGVHPVDDAHLASILEQAGVMSRLIDDLRTLALSEAGTLALHREPTDPDVLIDEVVRSFHAAASTADVTVRSESPSDLPIIEVDPVRIREVLGNLVGNAVRHTPAGGEVVVAAEATESVLTMRVRDTGPGIDPALMPHVFDRFVKGAQSGGSGLGLAIARYLVEAHGGTLEVEATGSGGTTFRAVLPLTR